MYVYILFDNLTCVFPSGPLPPQNLSLTHVTTNSALITWGRHPRHVPDGFVVNVTRGLNTRSRFLPNGKLGSYTLRELTPGQHYNVALTSVKNTGQEQIHSAARHLAFATCEWIVSFLVAAIRGRIFEMLRQLFAPIYSLASLDLSHFIWLQINSFYWDISFNPVPMEARSGRRERPGVTGQGTQVRRTHPPTQGGTAERDNSEELPRYRRRVNYY